MIKDIKLFLYGTFASLFCFAFISGGIFTLWFAYEIGFHADPFDILIVFVGSALGIAGINAFWGFLKEEDLI